ncbi:putative Mg2+ transporter-C (MgtC) family protein [Microbispora rosea]|uniref:Putative Mg2+ transporter-C (MgtC) family protein n=1 Tax=Microbispora rosea TaxID=58117 RepID=A0A1N7DGK4_9ACTN|nr:MgtC/SapB family protein [Microbispora rosea]SIR74875.1 putative Mg2+ transporter-C (MgtC) family protein [Microbispora rosea]
MTPFSPVVSAVAWWQPAVDLALALVLSAAIGLEREIRQKSAGLRTHTLVGFGAALFMLVSKHGFSDILGDSVVLDPSRVAAQIVSGIGFIGGGLIFVRRDAVKGLTTAAAVWLTAGVGMAAGAGLWLLAVLATAGNFVVMLGLTPLAARLPRSKHAQSRLRLSYADGRGVLRRALAECTGLRFVVDEVSLEQRGTSQEAGTVTVTLLIHGPGSIADLTSRLAETEGVLTVACADAEHL